jgi:tetratricopeptide (TPR) repeat protein
MPMRFHAADRYTLLPSLALATGAVLGLTALARRMGRPNHGTAALLGLSLAFVPLNVLRQREWRDGVTLFEANRTAEPSVWEVRFNLAGAYGGEGRWSDAIRELEEAWRLDPSKRRVLGDLFFAHAARAGRGGEWIDRHTSPIERAGFSGGAFLTQASEVMGQEDTELARVLVDLGTRDGDKAEAHAVLAKIGRVEGHLEDSLMVARKALELSPANEYPLVDVILALADLGRLDEAREAAAADAHNPRVQPLITGARGYVLFKMGRSSEAAALLDQARTSLNLPAAVK